MYIAHILLIENEMKWTELGKESSASGSYMKDVSSHAQIIIERLAKAGLSEKWHKKEAKT